MKKNRMHLMFTVFLIILTFALLFQSEGSAHFLPALQQVKPSFFLIGVISLFLFWLMEALSLQTLFQGLGIQTRLSRMYRYTLADFYVSSITPGACGGQPAKLYFMSRDALPPGASSLCVLLFNTCYHISMLLIVGVAFLSGRLKPIASHFGARTLLTYGIFIQLGLILLFSALAFSKSLAPVVLHRLIDALCKIRIIKDSGRRHEKLREQIALYRSGSAYFLHHPRILAKTLVFTTLHLLLLYSLPYWACRSLGVRGARFSIVLLLQAGVTIGVESLPLPGGVGAGEGVFLLAFSGIFPQELLLSVLLLSRGLSYYLGLLIGGISTWFMTKKCRTFRRQDVCDGLLNHFPKTMLSGRKCTDS